VTPKETFGRCGNPRCVLQRHTVSKGNVWHQAADGRAWITVRENKKP